jgi:hypothetical protein
MSLFEKRARYSIAISLLNRVRHWLQKRPGATLLPKDLETIKESLEFNKGENPSHVLLYNLQGVNDKEKAVSVQLADVFNAAIKQNSKDKETMSEKISLLEKSFNNTEELRENKERLDFSIDVITKSINILALHSEDKTSTMITPKVL